MASSVKIFFHVKIVSIFLLCIFVDAYSVSANTETLMNLAKKHYYGIGIAKNPVRAFKLYLKAAQEGDVDGMFIVGGMYMQGQGTAVNQKEAFYWLYQAARNGRSSKESQRILGQFFLLGHNVPQNYEEALHWYELAAMGGDAEAQSELAYLYFTGQFVTRDYEKARHWFEVAAMKGYPLAQYNMGILWYTGNGVDGVDHQKAYGWFSLAAANGHPNGQVAKQFLETMLTPEELLKGQQYSIGLYNKIRNPKQ